ncbi:hypothetical protein TFLX_04287 [Thermoflexales bacterium]|nr:hypothetical protein TFLX_04287 [Thermoflexales bacterium]
MYTTEPPGPLKRLRPGDMLAIGRDWPESFTPAQPDTIDLLETLQQAWQSICSVYDINTELPETQCLFEGADPRMPRQAAETVVANLLLSALEEVGRFSPTYKKPIGLIHVRDRTANRSSWLLAPETRARWAEMLQALAIAIARNTGAMLAADVLGEWVKGNAEDASRVMACCWCVPPRAILLNRTALGHANIVCETCQQPFHLIDAPEEDD